MQTSGQRPAALDGPACPEPLAYLWPWYVSLAGRRGVPEAPLTWPEIEAWSRLHGLQPTRFELDCLAHLDAVYVKLRAEDSRRRASASRRRK